MDPLLPWDVVEHIIYECRHSFSSLQNISLSCRAVLLPIARRHLFRRVKLLDDSDLYAFGELLDRKPRLCWYVQAVSLYNTTGERKPGALHTVVPATLLIRLPNLREWVIKSPERSACHDDSVTVEPLWMSFRPLSLAFLRACSSNVETLELNAVSFSTCSDFVLYVSAFPQLRTLKCTRVQVKEVVLTNEALVDRLSRRLKLQNVHIREITQRTILELLNILAQATVQYLWIDLYDMTVGPMLSYPTSFCLCKRLVAITKIIPDAHPDPLHVWATMDSVGQGVAYMSSILRRITLEISPKHLHDLITRRSEPFEGLQKMALGQSKKTLEVSVPGERANRVAAASAALQRLFPALHYHGLLKLDFPSQRMPGHLGAVRIMTISPDSRWLVTASEDKTIILWDVRENSTLREWTLDTPITFLVFSPDSNRLAFPRCGTGGLEAAICIVQDDDLLGSLSGHAAPVTACVWCPNNTKLASTASEGPDTVTVRVWDAETYEQIYTLCDLLRLPTCAQAQFSPDGRWLHVASESPHRGMTVSRVYHAGTGTPYLTLENKHLTTTATFDSTSRLLATASGNGSVLLWQMQMMERLEVGASEAQAHPCGRLATIAFSEDGTQVFLAWAVLSTVMVQVWDLARGDTYRLMSLEGHGGSEPESVTALAFSPDARYVASGSGDKTVRLWRLRDGSCVATFAEHDAEVGHVEFSPDGETLCSGAQDGSVVIRKLRHLIARRNA